METTKQRDLRSRDCSKLDHRFGGGFFLALVNRPLPLLSKGKKRFRQALVSSRESMAEPGPLGSGEEVEPDKVDAKKRLTSVTYFKVFGVE